MSWTMREVRSGAWVERELTPGTLLDLDDDRTPDQMRYDTLTERVARGMADYERHRARVNATATHDPWYPEHYATMQATQATYEAILATVSTLLGDEAAYQMRETASALALDA